jgi:DNA modification methylase
MAVERNNGHPTPKPLGLMRDWILLFTDEGETVLDPFMGSGTTGVACLTLGRRFIGVEKREEYFDIACRRIDDAQKQGNLFVPAYTQESLL